MLSCSIRHRMFTSRKLEKWALVCTTRVHYCFCRFAFFRSCATIVLIFTGTYYVLIDWVHEWEQVRHAGAGFRDEFYDQSKRCHVISLFWVPVYLWKLFYFHEIQRPNLSVLLWWTKGAPSVPPSVPPFALLLLIFLYHLQTRFVSF